MKRLFVIFLLILFVLSGCGVKKRVIEIPAPSSPPDPAMMEPTEPIPTE